MMEDFNPQLSRAGSLSEGLRKIIMNVSKYYLSIKETEFSQLRLYDMNNWWSFGSSYMERLNAINSYIDKRPIDIRFSEYCSINVPGNRSSVPCRHFHRFQWTDEQLEGAVHDIVQRIIEKHSYVVRDIKERVANLERPNEKRYLRKGGRVKDTLMACNYNFRKTIDILKRVSQSPCVDTVFLPAEKVLNSKSREEGIHFNTMPFGEDTDRMAIKLKATCEGE